MGQFDHVVVVGYGRSAVAKSGKKGALRNMHPVTMGGLNLKGVLEKVPQLPVDQIDDLIVGCAIPERKQGFNMARLVAARAGLPDSVCGMTINRFCSSGLQAIALAAGQIACGVADVMVAGGVESMTNAPFLVPSKVRNGVKMGDMKLIDSMLHDGLTDGMYNIHMGVTADNIAKKYDISREAQDEFAYASQQKAIAAIDSGRFKDEIVPVEVPGRKGTVNIFDTDEHPNRTTTMEKMAKLRPAFTPDGTVTAGNASGINDGASFTIVVSEDALKKYNLTPMCEIIGIGQGGVDPLTMGLGPTPAIRNALNYAGVKLDDMDLVELNEAFAAQSLGVLHELQEEHGIDLEQFKEKVNVNGGAIALGHPVGASGNRILVSLIYEMIKRDAKMGLASLCIGGGQGCAVIVKRP